MSLFSPFSHYAISPLPMPLFDIIIARHSCRIRCAYFAAS